MLKKGEKALRKARAIIKLKALKLKKLQKKRYIQWID